MLQDQLIKNGIKKEIDFFNSKNHKDIEKEKDIFIDDLFKMFLTKYLKKNKKSCIESIQWDAEKKQVYLVESLPE